LLAIVGRQVTVFVHSWPKHMVLSNLLITPDVEKGRGHKPIKIPDKTLIPHKVGIFK
jgi:hypothetical protein